MEIKKYREKTHITQKKLANDLKIPTATLNRYENGQTDPNIETLIKLANYFNISTDNLIGREYSKELSKDAQELLSIFEQMSQTNKDRLIGYAKRTLEIEKEDKIKLFKKES